MYVVNTCHIEFAAWWNVCCECVLGVCEYRWRMVV